MLDLSHIVVGIDFSAGSAVATRRAATLAAAAGANLHLVHADVLFHTSADGVFRDVPPSQQRQRLRLRLERFAEEQGVDADAILVVERGVGVPNTVMRYAERVGADLLVLGSYGHGIVSRVLLGSIAEAVVSSATCPVLTVPPDEAPMPGPDAPVLIAVDFSERSRAALAAGAALSELTDAPLELAHVVRGSGPYPGAAPRVFSLWDIDPQAADTVRGRLLRFAAGTPVAETHVLHGSPGRVLPDLAVTRGAGALVVGTHGRGDLARAILGSVAQAALRRAPCPVLTVAQTRAAVPAPVRSALGASSA